MIFREIKSSPTHVATKIKALFGESAPYFCKAKNYMPLEKAEKHWINHFKLKDQQQQTSNNPHKEEWEIRMEERDFEDWQKKEKMHFLFFDGASRGNPAYQGQEGS